MSKDCLGSYFDIHGGGMDLKFPHHENEIAQSEAASGHKFVNYWMHNGFVQIDNEKMSKSLGNFFTVREVLARYQPEVIRFFILSSHYRRPLNYSDDNLKDAKAALDRLYIALRDLPRGELVVAGTYQESFRAAMDDDFNTPEALSVLFDLAREINRVRDADIKKAARLGVNLRRLGDILGLLQDDPDNFLKGIGAEVEQILPVVAIEALIAQRTAARKARNWAEADRIRGFLKVKGIVVEDGPEGTTWRRA
jgi:cysteinyl-tRNA synthetase